MTYKARVCTAAMAWAKASNIKSQLEKTIKNTEDPKMLRKLEKRLQRFNKKVDKLRRLYFRANLNYMRTHVARGPFPVQCQEMKVILNKIKDFNKARAQESK